MMPNGQCCGQGQESTQMDFHGIDTAQVLGQHAFAHKEANRSFANKQANKFPHATLFACFCITRSNCTRAISMGQHTHHFSISAATVSSTCRHEATNQMVPLSTGTLHITCTPTHLTCPCMHTLCAVVKTALGEQVW